LSLCVKVCSESVGLHLIKLDVDIKLACS
jgi:hypothetical protein